MIFVAVGEEIFFRYYLLYYIGTNNLLLAGAFSIFLFVLNHLCTKWNQSFTAKHNNIHSN
jgi:membrane protease YdiL (CAAX protease family)